MPRRTGTDQDLLAMALVGYEAQMAKIDAAIKDIQAQLGHRVRGVQELQQMGRLRENVL